VRSGDDRILDYGHRCGGAWIVKSKFDLSKALVDSAEKYDDPLLWRCAIEAHELKKRVEKRWWDSLRDWTLTVLLSAWVIRTIVERVWR
jgi:hypothetical protein